MNNFMFSKTMENVNKRVAVKLIISWENVSKRASARDLIAKLNFKKLRDILRKLNCYSNETFEGNI